jgi:hypothetical protein
MSQGTPHNLRGNRGPYELSSAMKSKDVPGEWDAEARMSHHKNSNSLSEDNVVGKASSDRNSLDFITQGTNKSEVVTVSTSYHVVSEELEKGEMAEG